MKKLTARLKVKPEEIKAVVASYSDTGDIKKIQSNGFHVAGMKYMTIKTDERSVYGMKVQRRLRSAKRIR